MNNEVSDKDLVHPVSLGMPGYHTAMVHLYRGEMARMTVWRQRLDVTSNWAILLSVALTTFTLGSSTVPHYTLLLGIALLTISIIIEARRYRHLYHSKWRIFLMEVGYFSQLMNPLPGQTQVQWRNLLTEDLRKPNFSLHLFTALRVRLRRNYLLLLFFITGAWVTKLYIHPESPAGTQAFLSRLAVGEFIPAWLVGISALVFVVGATTLAVTCPSAEKLEDWSSRLD
jgi:uncharacterized membrane protein